MNQLENLVDRYLGIWNETDRTRRNELITETWTEDASFLDPVLKADGHVGIDEMVQQVQEKFPEHRFRRCSKIDELENRFRFSWQLAVEGQPPVFAGTDIGFLAADGKLQAITGFFDDLPN